MSGLQRVLDYFRRSLLGQTVLAGVFALTAGVVGVAADWKSLFPHPDKSTVETPRPDPLPKKPVEPSDPQLAKTDPDTTSGPVKSPTVEQKTTPKALEIANAPSGQTGASYRPAQDPPAKLELSNVPTQ